MTTFAENILIFSLGFHAHGLLVEYVYSYDMSYSIIDILIVILYLYFLRRTDKYANSNT